MDVHELADRLYGRVVARLTATGRDQIDSLMAEETPAACVGLVYDALRHGDLRPDELAAAIELARDNKFLASSQWLLDRLIDLPRQTSPAASA